MEHFNDEELKLLQIDQKYKDIINKVSLETKEDIINSIE